MSLTSAANTTWHGVPGTLTSAPALPNGTVWNSNTMMPYPYPETVKLIGPEIPYVTDNLDVDALIKRMRVAAMGNATRTPPTPVLHAMGGVQAGDIVVRKVANGHLVMVVGINSAEPQIFVASTDEELSEVLKLAVVTDKVSK